MVRIECPTGVYTIERRIWSGPDDEVVETLGLLTSVWLSRQYIPDPDYAAALQAAPLLQGRITQHDSLEYVPGRIY